MSSKASRRLGVIAVSVSVLLVAVAVTYAATTSRSVIAKAQQDVANLYRGTDRSLPKSGPAAVKNKSVWVITCTMLSGGCAVPATNAMEAGKRIGWKMTLADGKLDPSVYNAQIRAAVADHANAIILIGIDCASATAALQNARAAKIVIYAFASSDCNKNGGKKLFSGILTWGKNRVDANTFLKNNDGPELADYTIARTNGKGEVILLDGTDFDGFKAFSTGFANELKKCAGCKLDRAPFGIADVSTHLQTISAAALTKYPKATVFVTPIDGAIPLGVLSAVTRARASGRKIMLLGDGGLQANLKLVQSGVQDADLAVPSAWFGWIAIDGVNRLFAGKSDVNAGFGEQLFDKAHPPKTTTYLGNARSNWKANYLRIWKVK